MLRASVERMLRVLTADGGAPNGNASFADIEIAIDAVVGDKNQGGANRSEKGHKVEKTKSSPSNSIGSSSPLSFQLLLLYEHVRRSHYAAYGLP